MPQNLHLLYVHPSAISSIGHVMPQQTALTSNARKRNGRLAACPANTYKREAEQNEGKASGERLLHRNKQGNDQEITIWGQSPFGSRAIADKDGMGWDGGRSV